MTSILVLDGQLEIEFKKRSMRTYLTETRIIEELEVDSLDSDLERVLALNFARFMANTESITLMLGDGRESTDLVISWHKFWEYSRTHTGYGHLFVAYTEQLPIEANNVWFDAYTQFESGDPALNPIELRSPDLVPDELLNDPDVKKNDGINDIA